jgi:hypothetical protein
MAARSAHDLLGRTGDGLGARFDEGGHRLTHFALIAVVSGSAQLSVIIARAAMI